MTRKKFTIISNIFLSKNFVRRNIKNPTENKNKAKYAIAKNAKFRKWKSITVESQNEFEKPKFILLTKSPRFNLPN